MLRTIRPYPDHSEEGPRVEALLVAGRLKTPSKCLPNTVGVAGGGR
ncbi:MAG: hypothetical protein PWP58_679 [Bacillota bacterium]|jgi:hypothetical protein|nr:hypothetical protein [Bacillota bacterium]